MVEGLNTAQLRCAMHAVAELGDVRELRDYPRAAAATLRSLIPCDLAGYNALDLSSRRAIVAADPPDCVFEGGPEALGRFVHQNPMLARALRSPGGAMRLSDFITRRALHRTELYAHVYSRIPQEHQLGLMLSASGPAHGRPAQPIALTLGRARHDFTDSHLRLLEALRPHFERTFERLSELAFLRATMDVGTDQRFPWLLLVDGHWIVAWASSAAAAGLDLTPGTALPPALRRWLIAARARRSASSNARVVLDGLPFGVRWVPDAYPALDALHLTPLTGRVSAATLRSLGLTSRQAEVLQLALAGSTAARIADELSLSRRTVEKHFEAIYARLGAANRAQAIIAALQRTGQ
jgi:DNA-binding CsgD family transcriptional regulator